VPWGNEMPDDGFNKEAVIKLPIGHLLIIWNILSSKLANSEIHNDLTEEEKRALWSLEDLCEEELIKNGITGRPVKEWEKLIEDATEFVKTIPAEYLN
jgi:uncharacterized protein YajQ (UPF0234 family)